MKRIDLLEWMYKAAKDNIDFSLQRYSLKVRVGRARGVFPLLQVLECMFTFGNIDEETRFIIVFGDEEWHHIPLKSIISLDELEII